MPKTASIKKQTKKPVKKVSTAKVEEPTKEPVRYRRIRITKVVSRNFFMDFWANLQNLVGSNLKAYERMVDKAFEQIEDELTDRELDLEWYRHEVSQLTNGAVIVVLYGEGDILYGFISSILSIAFVIPSFIISCAFLGTTVIAL